jgi:hypothetical protein
MQEEIEQQRSRRHAGSTQLAQVAVDMSVSLFTVRSVASCMVLHRHLLSQKKANKSCTPSVPDSFIGAGEAMQGGNQCKFIKTLTPL